MKLIVGLGNIGPKYDKTRHNAGFMALDNFAFTRELGTFEHKDKLSAEVLEGEVNGERLLLAKPTTFMNRSGEALINIKRYFSVNSETTLVIYDDVDLDFGKIRIRKGGGSGGHNGIRSLPPPVQDNSFRIRIGVKNEHREQKETAQFVLERFMPNETDTLPVIFKKTDELIEEYLSDSLEEKTTRLEQSE